MTRKTKAEAKQTRSKIIDSALKIFSQKGYSRTTLEEIATEAGVTRGAIYWYFKNKVQIYEELVDEIKEVSGEILNPVLIDHHASVSDLKEAIKACLFCFEEDKRFSKIYEMANFKTELTEDLKGFMTKDRQKIHEKIKDFESLFTRFKARRLVRDDLDESHAAMALCAYILGLVDTWFFDKDAFSMKKTAPILIDTFFEGLY